MVAAAPFHVISRATGALGEVRREVWRTARHPCLWRAYLFKEGLRTVVKIKGEEGK